MRRCVVCVLALTVVIGGTRLVNAQRVATSTTERADEARTLLASLRARPVAADLREVSVSEALDVVAARSGVRIAYKRTVVDAPPRTITGSSSRANIAGSALRHRL